MKSFLAAAEKVSLFREKKLHYTLVLWFFDLVGKFALLKLKNESYFLNHDTLIRTLIFLGEQEKQTLHISDDIEKSKLQVKPKKKAVKVMVDKFVECVKLMEEKNDMSFMIKGNGLKMKWDKIKKRILHLLKKLLLNCKVKKLCSWIQSVFLYFYSAS